MDDIIKKGTKINQLNFLNTILFLASPLLAIPTIFLGLYKKQKFSLYLFILFASLITYQLVPGDEMDLYQFYRFYKDVHNLSLEAFYDILKTKPDFIVYLGIYLLAKLGFSGQVIFSLYTFITLHIIYLVYNKFALSDKISNKYYLLGIITVFISIELLGLYSGVRNMLAVSILTLSFYLSYFEKNKIKGFTLFVLAAFTHFGVLLFFPVYFFSIIKPFRRKVIFIIYVFSFSFLFLSKDYLYQIASILPLTPVIQEKAAGYLQGLDFIELGNLKSFSALISYKIRISWLYFAHAYIFISYKRNSGYRDLVVLLMCLLNILSVAPDIHLRLTYLVELMFIYLLYYEYNYKYNKLFIILFLGFLIPSFIVNLVIYRVYLMDSLFNQDFLTLIGILMKKVELTFTW